MEARNVIKQLATAEDLLHGVGKINQSRRGQVFELSKIDIALGLSSTAELAFVDPLRYSRVRVGNTEYEYISGAWQERLVIAPYPLVAGIILDARYNQVIKDGIIARYVGILPYTTDGLEDLNTSDWEIIGGGSGGGTGAGIEYVTTMPTSGLVEGTTLFQQNSYDLGFTVNDGDTTQIIEFDMLGGAAFQASGSGATTTVANTGGTGNTLVNTLSPTSYAIKRIKAGPNVSITDDGNALSIAASGSGGGTTTLSNAGSTGFPLVQDLVGADYPIRRLLAGPNVSIVDNGTYYTISATGASSGITSLENIATGTGVDVYKDTIANVGRFRRLQSSDLSIDLMADFDDIDIKVAAVAYGLVDQVPTATLLGRSTAGVGEAEAITIGANLTLTGGVLAATGGGGVSDGDKGDIVVSGSGTSWMFDTNVVTAFAKTLLDDTTAATMRTTLGLGTAATSASTAFQSADATLTALAGVTTAANQLIYATGADAFTVTSLTALARTLLGNSTVNAMLTTLGIIVVTNADGTCIKFPTAGATSGIQVCFYSGLSTGSISTASGGIFVGTGQQWNFPVAFSSAPAVCGFIISNAACWLGGGQSVPNVNSCFFRGYSGVSGTSGNVCMIAVGAY